MLLEPVPRERPTLTIIIPVYENYGKIHNLLASINFRYRTIFNFEILVIDETNDDRFRDYMVEWTSLYPDKIYYFNSQQFSYSWGSAIAFGIKKSYGHFIKIMDVNDTFVFFEFTNYIKILNSLISNNKTKKPDLIISSFEYYHDVEHLGTNKYFPGAKSKKTKFIDGEKLKLKESISHHALTFSREILQHAKEIPSDLFFTDAPLIQDILQHTKKIAITSKELIFLKFHITNNKVIFANYLHRKHENLKETLLYILDHMHVNNKNSINVSNNIVKITESFIYTMFLLIITNEKLFHVQKKNEINDLISFIEKKYKNKFNIKWIKHVTKFGREIISTNDNEKLIRIYKKLLNEIYGKNWKFFNFEIQKNINDLKKKNNNIKN